jgi:hypothetical protein
MCDCPDIQRGCGIFTRQFSVLLSFVKYQDLSSNNGQKVLQKMFISWKTDAYRNYTQFNLSLPRARKLSRHRQAIYHACMLSEMVQDTDISEN